MSLTQIVVLAIVQGVTLVLPVASSSHMAIVYALTAWPVPTPQALVAIQFGVFIATLAFFGAEVWEMAVGVVRAAKGKRNPEAGLAIQFVVASVLAAGIAFALNRYVMTDDWRTPKIMAWTTLGFGVLLLAFDQMSMTVKRVEHAGVGDTVFVALAQVLALVPGVSRTGVTMSFARFLGYERAEAAKFSYLLSLPMLFGLLALRIYRLFDAHDLSFTRFDIVSALIAFFASLAMLGIVMGFLQRRTFTAFVIYRLIVGGILALMAYDIIAL